MKKLNKIQIILTIYLFLYTSAAFASDFGAGWRRRTGDKEREREREYAAASWCFD